MAATFFWYDLETSGTNAIDDRILQFAGQRTDADLNPVGAPVNQLVKPTQDALLDPGAMAVTLLNAASKARGGTVRSQQTTVFEK